MVRGIPLPLERRRLLPKTFCDEYYDYVALVTCHGCNKTFTPTSIDGVEEGRY